MGQLRKPKKKKVTEKPEDMPEEVWQGELVRRKVMTDDRNKPRLVQRDKKNAMIVEAAEAEYLGKHCGKNVPAGASQGSSTMGGSRPRSPSSPAFFSEPVQATSRS